MKKEKTNSLEMKENILLTILILSAKSTAYINGVVFSGNGTYGKCRSSIIRIPFSLLL